MPTNPQVVNTPEVTREPAPWMWVDQQTYTAIRGCSVKTLQRERRLNSGCRFRRISRTSVRYKMNDITAFIESQPAGGGTPVSARAAAGKRGRPKRLDSF